MRTLRLSLVGALALALVGASAASVAAQHEVGTGPEFAWVTSVTEENCWQDWGSQRGGDGPGYTWMRGLPYGCDLESSDPRVSGTMSGTFSDDCFGDPDVTCVFWNPEEIAGPDGSWTGWSWGTHRPEDPEDMRAAPLITLLKVFTGHGAYDGLTFPPAWPRCARRGCGLPRAHLRGCAAAAARRVAVPDAIYRR